MGRRKRRELSVEGILAASVPILAEEGERGLSMRRVATALGVTPMALYHHVPDKDALVDLVVDRVLSEALETEPDADQDWRSALVDFAVAYRALLVDNPGIGAVYLRRPIVVPATARTSIRLFELLERGGVRGKAVTDAADAIVLVIMGSLANDLSRPSEIRMRLADQLPEPEAARLRPNLASYADRDPEARFRQALDWVLRGALPED